MEQVVFSEEAVADRIRQIRDVYDDVVRVKERLKDIVADASAQADYFTLVPSCTIFTQHYVSTADTVAGLFKDAQDNLDLVIGVFRDTATTLYASNTSIAEDFAAIDNLQLAADQRVVPPPPPTLMGVRGQTIA